MERHKNFLEDIASEKPESYKEEVFIPARKGPGRIIAAIAAAVIVIAVLFFLQQAGKVSVPAMSAWQLDEVQDWVSKYHENTVLNGVYSKDVALNGIISQDIEVGKKIGKDTSFTVTYSLGANPDEAVAVPDLKNMALTDIQSWIDENQMSGVTIQYETSDLIPKDSVISLEYIEGSQEQFLRKNRMIIYVSSGTQDMDETIEMPDLYGKTRAELMQWSQENQVKIDITEEFNQYVDYDKVFEQSIKTDTKITRNDTVSVTISRGKPIKVPDFTGISRSEASDLAAIYGINLYFRLEVSTEEADTVLSQDTEAGTEIDGQQLVILIIAKEDGKSVVPDFTGLTKNEADSLAALYGIKLFAKNSDEFGSSGVVASQSAASGKKIDEGQVVTVTLKEKDDFIAVPDFTGMTKNEATIAAQKLGLQLLFNETETVKTENQLVLSQSIKAKEPAEQGDTILLNIAVNSGIKSINILDKNMNEAQAWAAGKGVNLNVIEFYSGVHSTGELYYQDIEEGDYIPSNKVLTIYKSLGLVMADNFIGKTKADIINWKDEVNSKGANIQLKFIDDKNTPKAKGTITDQNIFGELVQLNQTIQVCVSVSDDGVLIKDFTGMSADDLKLWCEANNVPYIVTDRYSDTIAKGTLFGQNYTDAYLPKNEYLKIYNSIGKVYLEDFTNHTKSEILSWQKDVNSKGADIKIDFISSPPGIDGVERILYQSVKDTEIGLNDTITVLYEEGS